MADTAVSLTARLASTSVSDKPTKVSPLNVLKLLKLDF